MRTAGATLASLPLEPNMDLPDQKGRVAVITGANTGIGEVTARELARAGARVYLACRSTQKATEAMGRIRTEVPDAELKFLKLDLASQASIREAAAELRELEDEIDLLINNAGLAGPKGTTEEGFELTFGVNHLGHFLLTLLLVDLVIAADNSRIVNVSSKAHYAAKGIDWEALRKPTQTSTAMPEYQVSKLANVLFTNELERRLADTDVTTYSLHPGVVASDIWGRSLLGKLVGLFAPLFMISVDDGAKTTLHCATAPEAAEQSGQYWDECKVRRPNKLAHDEALAAELWAKSLEWTEAPDWPR